MNRNARNEHLSALDRAAILAYEESMGRTLRDPGRLEAVYSAKFAAEPVHARIKLICQTAMHTLNTDGCAANLVTAREQYDIVANDDIDVDDGLCRFVITERASFMVKSATTHKLVCEATAVTEKGIRSYLGLPLLWDDYAVGAFCVFSNKDREWKPYEVQVLATMATTVVDTMSWGAREV